MRKAEDVYCPCQPHGSAYRHKASPPPAGSFKCCGAETAVRNPEHPRFRKCVVCGAYYWLRPLDGGRSAMERVSDEGMTTLRTLMVV